MGGAGFGVWGVPFVVFFFGGGEVVVRLEGFGYLCPSIYTLLPQMALIRFRIRWAEHLAACRGSFDSSRVQGYAFRAYSHRQKR